MTVTICIPAYRAEAFLAQTVRSALAQTHADIVVDVAIEPPGDGERAACAPLMQADPRLRVSVNDTVLGWAENIAAMLRRVRTAYFMILPHDDFLHAQYVELLLSVLERRPDALLAYGDIQYISGGFPQRRRQILAEGGVEERLLSFLASGAEAPIWRGVTRTDRVDGAFPTDSYKGLLVETEWALHLLTRGVALRVPRTLYFKRFFTDGRVTASSIRNRAERNILHEGVEDHYRRLRVRAEAALGGELPPLLLDGLQSIRAKRLLEHGLADFGQEFEASIVRCQQDQSPYASVIFANMLTAQSRAAQLSGDIASALEFSSKAVAVDEKNVAAQAQRARALHATGDRFGALQAITAACDAEPYALGLRELTLLIESDFFNSLST